MHFHWKVLPQEIVCAYDSRLFLTHTHTRKKHIFEATLMTEFFVAKGKTKCPGGEGGRKKREKLS